MKNKHFWKWQLLCNLLFVGAGALILIGSAKLPGPEYDPLGPAGLPRYIAYALLLLSAIRLIQIVTENRLLTQENPGTEEASSQVGKAVLTSVIVVVYLLALHFGHFTFVVDTLVFLAFSGCAMVGFSRSKLVTLMAIAIAVSFGLTYVFGDLLQIILPG